MELVKKLIKISNKIISSDGHFIIFSALLYLFFAGVYLKTHAFIGTDGCNYAIGTENIARGKGFTRDGRPITLFMPLYSYAAVPFYLLFKNSETATRFVSLLSGILTLPLLYFLVKRLFNVGIAKISTFLLATNTPFMKVSSDVLVEGMMLMLLICACYFYAQLIWYNEKRKSEPLFLVLFSLFFGLATLTRPDALFFYLLFLLFYIVAKSEKLVNKFIKILFSTFIFTLVLIPQISFQYRHKGRIQITDKVQNHLLWGDLYAFMDKKSYYKISAFKVYDALGLPLPPDVERPPDLTNFSAVSFILQNPEKLIKRAYFNLLQGIGFLNKGMVLPLLWLFCIIGLVTLLRRNDYRVKLVWLLLFFVPALLLLLTHYEQRFVLSQICVLLVISAVGVHQLVQYLPQLNHPQRFILKVIVILTFIYYPFAENYTYVKKFYSPNPYQIYKKAGSWLRSQIREPEKTLVVGFKPWICFYAGTRCELVPWIESLELLIKYLQRINADFLVVQKRELRNRHETLMSLIDEQSKISGLILLYTDQNRRDKIIIYKVEK